MIGNTEFEIGGNVVTFDELQWLWCANLLGHIPSHEVRGILTLQVLDSLQAKGLLTETGSNEYGWASQDVQEWYTNNSAEIEAIIDKENPQ
mgnify:CR=1 FL=1